MLRFLSFFLIFLMLACNGTEKNNQNDAPRKFKVTFYKVKKEVIPVYRIFSGTVSSENMVELSPKVAGYITKINYSEGMRFKKGSVLFEINSPEMQERLKFTEAGLVEAYNGIEQSKIALKVAQDELNKANAQFDLAEKTYNRYKNLLKNESVSRHEFDQAEAQYKVAKEAKAQAEGNVRLAKERVNQSTSKKRQAEASRSEAATYAGYTKVVAPFDGVVLEKLVDTGNLVGIGQPVLRIGSTKNVVYIYLPEPMTGKVSVGMDIAMKAGSKDKYFKSKIIEISSNIDPVTRNFRVKSASQSDLTVGAYVDAYVEDGKKEALMVPIGAVSARGQLSVVFINNNGRADMRVVKTGSIINDKIEVLSGINDVDVIVEKNVEMLKSGDMLEG